MTTDTTHHNRLLLEISNCIRHLNRETIDPAIPELTLGDLKPVMKMVAHARANYLQQLFIAADAAENGVPSLDHIERLKEMRLIYEELVTGAQALETAIERGYLSVSRKGEGATECGGEG